jgi:large subunit ribosomal protein L22
MKARAVAKYIKGSPQKARLVIDLIRGRNVNEALAVLAASNKRAAKPIEITLRSAIANATQKAEQINIAIDVDQLVVSTATVDLGPTKYRRRVRPAPMGRAYRERRWQSHITIEVESEKV